jgi:hypothetical protein
MRRFGTWAAVLAAGVVIGVLAVGRPTAAAPAAEPMIGHMVYFTLNDSSPAKVKDLVTACEKYLTEHAGEVIFMAGPRGKAFTRDVNDQKWDVSLFILFGTKADHDKYQDAPRHKRFIEENKANWKTVRVFDSLISGTRGVAG